MVKPTLCVGRVVFVYVAVISRVDFATGIARVETAVVPVVIGSRLLLARETGFRFLWPLQLLSAARANPLFILVYLNPLRGRIKVRYQWLERLHRDDNAVFSRMPDDAPFDDDAVMQLRVRADREHADKAVSSREGGIDDHHTTKSDRVDAIIACRPELVVNETHVAESCFTAKERIGQNTSGEFVVPHPS